jgi:c(7)-type cytochrome triheme protein
MPLPKTREVGSRAQVILAAFLLSLAFVVEEAAAQQSLGDIVMDRHSSANQQLAVVFPHWKHRLNFKCYACHPDVFEMRAGANEISMASLQAGEFCGRCHDGRTAFAIGFETCRTCHSHESQ